VLACDWRMLIFYFLFFLKWQTWFWSHVSKLWKSWRYSITPFWHRKKGWLWGLMVKMACVGKYRSMVRIGRPQECVQNAPLYHFFLCWYLLATVWYINIQKIVSIACSALLQFNFKTWVFSFLDSLFKKRKRK